MVHFLQCSSAHMPLGSLFLSILLLLSSSMEMTFSDARMLPIHHRLLQIDNIKEQQEEAAGETTTMRGEMTERRSLIGSRPPRCERVCRSCGHCEAVQVPIVPQKRRRSKRARREQQALSAETMMFSYRVNGIANYKPLSWKCKCGGAILDP